MARTNAPWREEELLRQKYCVEDLSSRELAELWDCDKKTILNWLDKFDIPTQNSHMEDKPWQDKETLERLYIDEGLSCAEIGDKLGCSGHTADKWCKKLGVSKKYRNREWLYEKYVEEDMYVYRIAELAGCSHRTITEWLQEFDLAQEYGPANYQDEQPWKDPDELQRAYHKEEKTIDEIATEWGCSPTTVRRNMIELGIERREGGNRVSVPKDARMGGYVQVSSSSNGSKKSVLLHRLIAYAAGKLSFEELCDSNTIVHHRNNIPWDNRPENLEAMSRGEHMEIHARSDYHPETV